MSNATKETAKWAGVILSFAFIIVTASVAYGMSLGDIEDNAHDIEKLENRITVLDEINQRLSRIEGQLEIYH